MKKFFAIVALALAFASCTPIQEQITVNDFSLESLENVFLAQKQLQMGTCLLVDATNESCWDITLAALNADLFSRNGKRVGTLTLDTRKGEKKPCLHHKTNEQVVIPLLVGLDNPLSAITLAAMSLDDFAEKGYTVDYDCTFRAGIFSKRMHAEKVPVDQLTKMF